MVFSSLTFLYIFLPCVFTFYFLLPPKFRNLVLLVFGLLFYAWGEPFYIVIMLFSTFIDYFAGRCIDKFNHNNRLKRLFLIISVVMNLGLLSIFKYSGLFVNSFNNLFGLDIGIPNLILPIGISFYTFQSMSYTIDLFMGKISVQKNIISFITYVTLFPQIVAGPIVRYNDVSKEIDCRTINYNKVSDGISLFCIGLGKKVLIANNIGLLWSTVQEIQIQSLTVVTAWLGIIAFAFQIYFDFSGYSDMACGLGRMLGFNFPKNFNYPYMSKSISEFWRRWHMTLGNWFKSYVYIPLGGNRKGYFKTIINLVIVWALTGFWHGANWNFLIWGLYFGVIIIAERFVFLKLLDKLPGFIRILYSFLLVLFGWVIFELDSLSDIVSYFSAMFGLNGAGFFNNDSLYLIFNYIIIIIICIFGCTNIFNKIYLRISKISSVLIEYSTPVFVALIILISTVYLVNASYNPFLYFNF